MDKKYTIYVKSAFDGDTYLEEFDNYDEAYSALENYQKSDPLNYYSLRIERRCVEEFDNYDEAYSALKNYQKSDPLNYYSLRIERR